MFKMHLLKLFLVTIFTFDQVHAVPAYHHGESQQSITRLYDNFTLNPIKDALISNKVIGDVLNDFTPTFYLDVVYTESDTRVILGNEISIADVQKRPHLGIYEIPNKKAPRTFSRPATFTVVLTDPDARSRYDPKWSEMCHWILTNITATSNEIDFSGSVVVDPVEDNDGATNHKLRDIFKQYPQKSHNKHVGERCEKDKKGGECRAGELKSYFAPGPPPKTGWHRYTFVLLEGDAAELYGPNKRKHWGYGKVRHGVRDWAIENKLNVVGANFFFAENEKQ